MPTPEATIKEQAAKLIKATDSKYALLINKSKGNKLTAEALEKQLGTKVEMAGEIVKLMDMVLNAKSLIKGLIEMNDTVEILNKSIEEDINNVMTKNDKLVEYFNIFDKIDEHMTDMKKEIKKTVDEGIKSVVEKSQPIEFESVIAKTVEETDKKWSDLFKTSKDEMKKQTKEAKNQSNLLEKSIAAAKQKQAVENIERQKRERNIAVRNIPESNKPDEKERIEEDRNAIMNMLNLDPEDIESVYRVGKKVEGMPRVLIAVLVTPNVAKQQHNYGRGRPINLDNKTYWVNADLIKEDREANFKARNQRRGIRTNIHNENRAHGSSEHPTDTTQKK